MEGTKEPAWAIFADKVDSSGTSKDHLLALLASTESAFKNHTDWFLGHKERGIRRLGVLIASQITVTGFYFRDQELYPEWLVVAVLLSMALIAITLALSTLHSCTRSYLAAMEQGMLKNKVVWALGLSSQDFHFGPGTVTVYPRAAPNTTSFRAEPCT